MKINWFLFAKNHENSLGSGLFYRADAVFD